MCANPHCDKTPPDDGAFCSVECARQDRAVVAEDTRAGLADAFDAVGFDIRLNIRAATEEWHDGSKWDTINDYAAEHIREEIAEQVLRVVGHDNNGDEVLAPWRVADNRWRNLINATLFEKQVDPFREWLENECTQAEPLPADTDIIRACGFEVDGHAYSDDYVRWIGWLPLHAAVARALHPSQRVRVDCMPILVGPIEIGKDTFYEAHFPDEHRLDWYCGTLCWADPLKEKVEKSGGAVFTSAVEMSGADRADLNGMKAWMTTPVAKVRLAYARRALNHIIRSVMVGTSNDLQHLPNDPHGNRRHAPLVVDGLPQMTAMQASGWWDDHRPAAWHRALIEVKEGRALSNRPITLKAEQERLADIHAVIPRRTDDGRMAGRGMPSRGRCERPPLQRRRAGFRHQPRQGRQARPHHENAAKRALKRCGYEPHTSAVRRNGQPQRRLWHNPNHADPLKEHEAPKSDRRDRRDTSRTILKPSSSTRHSSQDDESTGRRTAEHKQSGQPSQPSRLETPCISGESSVRGSQSGPSENWDPEGLTAKARESDGRSVSDACAQDSRP